MTAMTRQDMVEEAKTTIEMVDLSKELGEGKHTFVKGLTADERDNYETSIISIGEDNTPILDRMTDMQARAKLLVKCQCDEHGIRIWEDTDVDAVGALSGRVITKIFTVAQRLSGLSLADMKEMTKN